MDVSRETPATPEIARVLFSPDVLASLEAYAALLAGDGVERGLIGPREAPRLWDRHLLNSAVIEPLFARGARVADVGAGAGLPGVVLAIVRPDLEVTLVEPLLRRTTFLEEAVSVLALANVEVVRSRAEDLQGRRMFDAVTSRAVAPLGRLTGWCMPLVARGGAMHAMKGSRADVEILESSPDLIRMRCAPAAVSRWGEGVVSPQSVVVSVARRGEGAVP